MVSNCASGAETCMSKSSSSTCSFCNAIAAATPEQCCSICCHHACSVQACVHSKEVLPFCAQLAELLPCNFQLAHDYVQAVLPMATSACTNLHQHHHTHADNQGHLILHPVSCAVHAAAGGCPC